MSFMTCFDTASIVIDEASKRFAPSWKIHPERLDIFHDYCDALDDLSEEYEGTALDVSVDEESMEVIVALVCAEVLVKEPKHRFYDLCRHSTKFCFSSTKDCDLLVTFTFPPLWVKG